MKFTCADMLGLAIALHATLTPAKILRDMARKNVQVAEMESNAQIDTATQEVIFQDPTTDFEESLRCSKASGKQLTFSADKRFVGCCLPGQTLVGSKETAFDCCGAGHDLAGSAATGYTCCPTGQEYDGKVCKNAEPVCSNGKVLIEGRCTCPSGKVEAADGSCTTPSNGCSSGLQTGKCYTFTAENGHHYGYSNAGWYSAAKDSRNHVFGKFQLCTDDTCTSGKAVDPQTNLRIRDIHGQANSGANPNQWLNNAQNGGHIGKTPDFAKAGQFSLTKWPCGKYCLGGFEHGLGPTCPSEEPAVTFNTFDKQACVPVTVTEVPCDIHAPENNCIWKNGDQCCGRVDCAHVGGSHYIEGSLAAILERRANI